MPIFLRSIFDNYHILYTCYKHIGHLCMYVCVYIYVYARLNISFLRLDRWRMCVSNNIVITIIHRLLDSDNLLFYYYFISFLLYYKYYYTVHVIATSRRRMYTRRCLKKKKKKLNSTGMILIWCPPVGTSNHTYILAYMYIILCYYLEIHVRIQSGFTIDVRIQNCSRFIITV